MKFGQSILSKIIKIVATSCQISRLKCTKFDLGWDSAGGAYSAPPDLLAGFKGGVLLREGQGEREGKGGKGRPTSKGREGKGVEEREGKGWEVRRG